MTPDRLRRRLYDAGFSLQVCEGELLVSPAENLTPSICHKIEAAKSELMALLQQDTDQGAARCTDCDSYLPLSGVRCSTCRDACPDRTCASCGATIDGPDLSICDLCQVERKVAQVRERRDPMPKEEEPA